MLTKVNLVFARGRARHFHTAMPPKYVECRHVATAKIGTKAILASGLRPPRRISP